METQIEILTRKQHEAAARMQAILDDPAGEDGGLSAEQRTNLEQFDADFDRYQAQARELKSYKDKLEASDKLYESVNRSNFEREQFDEKPKGLLGHMLDVAQNRAEAAHMELRYSVPMGAQPGDNLPAEYRRFVNSETRALQSAGGSAIPTNFADFVAVYERTLNPVMQVATVLQTPNGQSIVISRITADVSGGSTVTAEAGGITEADATVSSIQLDSYKRGNTQLWSAELDTDNVIGLEGLLAFNIARAIGLAWGTAFTTATGSSDANGFINAGTNGGTAGGTALNTAADTFLAWSDLSDLFYGLQAPYRTNATWMVSNTALAKMRKFRDSTNQPIWSQPVSAGQPEMYLGHPVYENPAMAAVASASKSVAVGDFTRYIIRDVVPVRIDISRDYKFSTDQLAIRYLTRRDGDMADTTAIRYLVSANT